MIMFTHPGSGANSMHWMLVVALLCLLCTGAREAEGQSGSMYHASIAFSNSAVQRVEGDLFLPHDRPITALVVFAARGVSEDAFTSSLWRNSCARVRCGMLHVRFAGHDPANQPAQQLVRNAALGGGEALLELIDTLASSTGTAGLRSVPLVLWGFSAAGSFAVTFAALHPDRTAAFLRYHSNLRGLSIEIEALQSIPALILAGERDAVAGIQDSETFWAHGRARQAPWTYVLEPEAEHFPQGGGLQASLALQVAWMEGVLRQRIDQSGRLRPVRVGRGLTGDHSTGCTSPLRSAESQPRTSWLPDGATARAWQIRARRYVDRGC